ncbi:MAG: deoxyhypusine synthase [Candidatus Bathyarchaeota archaeon]|nr:MAG: deoxyhypusine synthase [Candidatus Bathyarchaeota archaeon]
MKKVKQIKLRRGMTASQLIKEMDACGVLGAGKMGKAAKLIAKMFADPDYTVFLTLAGALVPGGLRGIIAELIEHGYVNVLITTGANMVHDLVEALGFSHEIGVFEVQDEQLKNKEIGRIGDIYIQHKAFQELEKWLHHLLKELTEQECQRISPSSLLQKIGTQISQKDSILAAAARKEVPVICPGLPDSIIGFQLWTWSSSDKKLVLDSLGDISKLVDEVYQARKSGIIILGGGWPKHFTLFANTFREGVDTAVQITMDRPEPGGLSGATLKEAISWRKVKSNENTATVICDATIAFPLIVAAVLEEAQALREF